MNSDYVFIVTKGRKGKSSAWAEEVLYYTTLIDRRRLPALVQPKKLALARKQIFERLANFGRHVAYLAYLQLMVEEHGYEAVFYK